MTLDELLAEQPSSVAAAIETLTERAGTSDADWQVLRAAGEMITELKHRLAETTSLLITASDEVSCVCGVEIEDEPTPPEECTACCIDALLGTERASYR